jgi:Sulfotransferase family
VVRVLFLGGLGRSGTTLLERLLGQLPGVSPLGEVVHLWQRDLKDDERCGCGDRFSACGFWQKVGVEAFGGWDSVDAQRVLDLAACVERTRRIPGLALGRKPAGLAEYADHYSKVYTAAAAVTGADAVVDSSKHSALAYVLRHARDVDLRVIHVVRDSRGVAYSWTKKVPRPETETDEQMTRYSPSRSAMLWNAHNASFGLLGRLGVPVRRVRYEELLSDPLATLRSLARFAGLTESADELSFLRATDDGFVADLGPSHSAAGNPMRFTIGSVPLRSDEAWRRSLPRGQRRLVGALTAPLLSAYGYPLMGGGL